MTAYMVPLILMPVIIDGPGTYWTRCGERVQITKARPRGFGCTGTYSNGIPDDWHKSGRLYAAPECLNDIVEKERGL